MGVNNLFSNRCRILAPLKVSCVFKYTSTLPRWGADTDWIIIFGWTVPLEWGRFECCMIHHHPSSEFCFFEHFFPQIVLTDSYHLGVCLRAPWPRRQTSLLVTLARVLSRSPGSPPVSTVKLITGLFVLCRTLSFIQRWNALERFKWKGLQADWGGVDE